MLFRHFYESERSNKKKSLKYCFKWQSGMKNVLETYKNFNGMINMRDEDKPWRPLIQAIWII